MNMIKKLAVGFMALFTSAVAMAGTGGGSDFPVTAIIQKLADSLTGGLAKAIGICAFGGGALMLAFGGELDGVLKKLMVISFAVAITVTAGNIFNWLFSGAGCVI